MSIWGYYKGCNYVIYYNFIRYICHTVSSFILTKRHYEYSSIFCMFSIRVFLTRCLDYMSVPMQKSSGRIRTNLYLYVLFKLLYVIICQLVIKWFFCQMSFFFLQILSLLLSFRIVILLKERISFGIRGEVNLKTSTLILIPSSIIKKG